jgi:hypothetical protein
VVLNSLHPTSCSSYPSQSHRHSYHYSSIACIRINVYFLSEDWVVKMICCYRQIGDLFWCSGGLICKSGINGLVMYNIANTFGAGGCTIMTLFCLFAISTTDGVIFFAILTVWLWRCYFFFSILNWLHPTSGFSYPSQNRRHRSGVLEGCVLCLGLVWSKAWSCKLLAI